MGSDDSWRTRYRRKILSVLQGVVIVSTPVFPISSAVVDLASTALDPRAAQVVKGARRQRMSLRRLLTPRALIAGFIVGLFIVVSVGRLS